MYVPSKQSIYSVPSFLTSSFPLQLFLNSNSKGLFPKKKKPGCNSKRAKTTGGSTESLQKQKRVSKVGRFLRLQFHNRAAGFQNKVRLVTVPLARSESGIRPKTHTNRKTHNF